MSLRLPARLQRLALWLRLFLVCVVLTGVSAPAPTMGYREAVVAIATATVQAPEEQPAAPTPSRATRRATPAITAWPAAIAPRVDHERSPAPARRLYLINSALLC